MNHPDARNASHRTARPDHTYTPRRTGLYYHAVAVEKEGEARIGGVGASGGGKGGVGRRWAAASTDHERASADAAAAAGMDTLGVGGGDGGDALHLDARVVLVSCSLSAPQNFLGVRLNV